MHGKQSLDLFFSLNEIESLVATLLELKELERHGSSVQLVVDGKLREI